MKTLMILAVLMAVAGIVLGDAILGILGTVALACAGSDWLARHYQTRMVIAADPASSAQPY